MRIRIRTNYTVYPLSAKLTEKSKRISTIATPFLLFFWYPMLGALPGILLYYYFPSSVFPLFLIFIGAITVPVFVSDYRDKKLAEFDEEYEQLLIEIKKSGMSLFDYVKTTLPPNVLAICEKNANNPPMLKHYLSEISNLGLISDTCSNILLMGYLSEHKQNL